MQLGNEKDAEI